MDSSAFHKFAGTSGCNACSRNDGIVSRVFWRRLPSLLSRQLVETDEYWQATWVVSVSVWWLRRQWQCCRQKVKVRRDPVPSTVLHTRAGLAYTASKSGLPTRTSWRNFDVSKNVVTLSVPALTARCVEVLMLSVVGHKSK